MKENRFTISITKETYEIVKRVCEITDAKQFVIVELAIKAAFGELTDAERSILQGCILKIQGNKKGESNGNKNE